METFTIPQNDKNADWIKHANPKATEEDRRISKEVADKLKKEANAKLIPNR
jgi:hypothetical protein